MKETAGNMSDILFAYRSGTLVGSIFINRLHQVRTAFLQSIRQALPTMLASCGTGVILFIGISLFLYQLAEHGWK
jgi:hypothetical protein